ncbi:uncharacterized protein B0T15DRAFT_230931 [Chaetomium strumarium]|uniref:Uncharacterized protein n=1 Tax=Chaetomium strumarium TaxID=1170767 RepID=A0AAJ0GQM4_9PEZI|nr:hypothetical protein B0T15DRAFT_230931 [Chaetomium strumarium]
MTPPKALGGKPPRKRPPEEVVVDQAPSHDGAPCFTAYTRSAERHRPPLFALRIYDIMLYDTMPAAGDTERIRQLALQLHTGTEFERCDATAAPDLMRDRVQVVGLPMAADVPDGRRVECCQAHHMAEVAARIATRRRDYYLPATFHTDGWWRALVVIDRLEEGWEGVVLNRPRPERGFNWGRGKVPESKRTDPYGGFLYARWEVTEVARPYWEEAEAPLPEVDVTPYPVHWLAHCLAGMREHMSTFRDFIHMGGLEEELQAGVPISIKWASLPG